MDVKSLYTSIYKITLFLTALFFCVLPHPYHHPLHQRNGDVVVGSTSLINKQINSAVQNKTYFVSVMIFRPCVANFTIYLVKYQCTPRLWYWWVPKWRIGTILMSLERTKHISTDTVVKNKGKLYQNLKYISIYTLVSLINVSLLLELFIICFIYVNVCINKILFITWVGWVTCSSNSMDESNRGMVSTFNS